MSQSDPYGQQSGGQQPQYGQGGEQYGQQQYPQYGQGGEQYGQQQYPQYGQGGEQYGQQQYPQYGQGGEQYGQQQYPQYGYQQPGQYPPPGQQWGPQQQQGTNTLAILSLVFAFVFSPAGLVLGFIALKQVRERRQGGRGLAIAGIVISIISILLGILFIILAVTATKDLNDSVTSTSPAPTASASASSAPSSSSSSDSGSSGTTSVTTSCHQVLRLVKQSETASSPDALRNVGTQLRSYDNTDNSSYNQHVDTLASAYSTAADDIDNGNTPNATQLHNAGFDVGVDCGKRGVTLNNA